jgi:hypothetical protein
MLSTQYLSLLTSLLRHKALEKIDRDVIMDALRLASRLIDASLPFYHSIFLDKKRTVPGLAAGGALRLECIEEAFSLTDTEALETRAALEHVARDVFFELNDPGASYSTEIYSDGGGPSYSSIRLFMKG